MDKWRHFEFDGGANPYISITDENFNKCIKAWNKKGWNVERIKEGFYVVHDKGGGSHDAS